LITVEMLECVANYTYAFVVCLLC